jgi:DNA-binding LytR/AlgR family response regulator
LTIRALIAEDEPLLAESLRAQLAQMWPGLEVVSQVADGLSAVEEGLSCWPHILFLDVRMPGLTGLEVAAELADQWDTSHQPFPWVVFITAYDQYALAAFEAQAMDYLLKPVQPDRLRKTVQRLQHLLEVAATQVAQEGMAAQAAVGLEATMGALRLLLQAQSSPQEPFLQVIQASVGTSIHMVPVRDVVFFEAADKYVRMLTARQEYLLRTPLKDIQARLSPEQFWQIHRGILVQAGHIARANRTDAGKWQLELRDRPEKLTVSRIWAHRFRPL